MEAHFKKWYLEQLFSECLEKGKKTPGLNAYERK
mgnify:CR=1 FL=1